MLNYKEKLLLLAIWLVSVLVSGQGARLLSFPVSTVRLLDSPFRVAQQTDMAYVLALDPDRLLAPYRASAGLPPLAENYGNRVNIGLNAHIGGHCLSALASMAAATGDARVQQRLTYMLDQLELCQ